MDEAGAEPFRAAFRAALDNDLNTSLAVTVLYDVLKSPLNAATKRALFGEFDTVLALGLTDGEAASAAPAAAPTGGMTAAEIEAAIAARAEAKKNKNYAEADRIRAALAERGVTLPDTPSGTTYTVG